MACHRCSASVKDTEKAMQCPECGCKFHTHDCGKRLRNAGLEPELAANCPKCSNHCLCMKGPVVCHLGRTRQKREEGTPTGGVKREALDADDEEEEEREGRAPRSGRSLKRSNANTNAAAKELGLKAATVATGVRFAHPLAPGTFQPSADTAQLIQNAATSALTDCVASTGLMPPGNAHVVTAANAAAAAFAVILMSCYNTAAAGEEEAAHVEGADHGEAMEAPPDLFAQ